jgi:hypothetical protein
MHKAVSFAVDAVLLGMFSLILCADILFLSVRTGRVGTISWPWFCVMCLSAALLLCLHRERKPPSDDGGFLFAFLSNVCYYKASPHINFNHGGGVCRSHFDCSSDSFWEPT